MLISRPAAIILPGTLIIILGSIYILFGAIARLWQFFREMNQKTNWKNLPMMYIFILDWVAGMLQNCMFPGIMILFHYWKLLKNLITWRTTTNTRITTIISWQ